MEPIIVDNKEVSLGELKEMVYQELKVRGKGTIDDICKRLKTYDDFHVTATIPRLQNEGKIIEKKSEQVYDPDGRGILLAVYDVV